MLLAMLRTMKLWFLVSTLVGVASASSAHSLLRGGRNLQQTTATFQVEEDVFVRDGAASNRNYGDRTNLAVAYGPTDGERYGYTKFPLGFEVQNAVNISSAFVKMRVNTAPLTNPMNVQVFPCNSESWREEDLTWNFQPGYQNDTASLVTSQIVDLTMQAQWVTFDVTSAVEAAIADSKQTVSLVFQPERLYSQERMKFDSKEDLNNIPYLEVTYFSSGVTATPTQAPTSAPTVDWDQPPYPQLVTQATDGSLEYVPYANEINYSHGSTANPAVVNTVPDFSNVGYKGGGVPIPFVPVNRTVRRVAWPFCRWLLKCHPLSHRSLPFV